MSSSMAPLPQIYGIYALETIAVNNVTTDNPSWLHRDPSNGALYCLNEGLSVSNGSISSFKIGGDGSLSLLGNVPTINGPVSSVLFNRGKTLAAAHYGGSGITTHSVQADGTLKTPPNTNLQHDGPWPGFPTDKTSPTPTKPSLTQPSNSSWFPISAPISCASFPFDPKTALLTQQTPYKAPAASGPRHGVFHQTESGDTYYYLVSELGNKISSFESRIYGNQTTPAGAAAAVCLLTPDGRPHPPPARVTPQSFLPPQPPAHPQNKNFPSPPTQSKPGAFNSKLSYKDTPAGSLSFAQEFPSGGVYPRQMSLNKDGTLVAIALQQSARVVIVERDPESGLFGKFVADVQIGEFSTAASLNGQITSVIWDEELQIQGK
ncbi:hypothetical protein DID88_003178 [Monilinia fructigena]|uniref:Uncharacterized protein n=1 Tax=Monilinia fructigena TaxID=38457 RepID=A0A395IUK6_9HELO|nr:hypothetical protein DID88_003178 [Monilinia fructigena]